MSNFIPVEGSTDLVRDPNTDQIIKNVGIAIRSSLKQVISLDKEELLNQRKTKYLMTFNKS